jgi:hypothetical protein
MFNVKALSLAVMLSVFGTTPALSAESISYTYDILGRVIMVRYIGGTHDGLQITYSYDVMGNRTVLAVTGSAR